MDRTVNAKLAVHAYKEAVANLLSMEDNKDLWQDKEDSAAKEEWLVIVHEEPATFRSCLQITSSLEAQEIQDGIAKLQCTWNAKNCLLPIAPRPLQLPQTEAVKEAEEVGFFNPKQKDPENGPLITVGKHTVYRDVYSWSVDSIR